MPKAILSSFQFQSQILPILILNMIFVIHKKVFALGRFIEILFFIQRVFSPEEITGGGGGGKSKIYTDTHSRDSCVKYMAIRGVNQSFRNSCWCTRKIHAHINAYSVHKSSKQWA